MVVYTEMEFIRFLIQPESIDDHFGEKWIHAFREGIFFQCSILQEFGNKHTHICARV